MPQYLGKMVALVYFIFCFSVGISKYRFIVWFGELEAALSLYFLIMRKEELRNILIQLVENIQSTSLCYCMHWSSYLRKPPEAAFENWLVIIAVANCPHFKNKKKTPTYFLFWICPCPTSFFSSEVLFDLLLLYWRVCFEAFVPTGIYFQAGTQLLGNILLGIINKVSALTW